MQQVPTECKWCGCGDIERQSSCMQSVIVTFACGSMSDVKISETRWLRDSRCAGQVGNLYKRIRGAVQVLETAERYDVESCEDSVSFDYHDHGQQADAEVLDRTLEILRGNSPESPDSSPVTADDLAVADYYEAVRQRVPWMTSVQHIEQLVDGYRQCGLMVWKAAKHIEDLFGGEHGQTK